MAFLQGIAPKKIWIGLTVVGASLLVTVLSAYFMKIDADTAELRELQFACDQIEIEINARMKAHEQILRSGVALFNASDHVTREDWHKFTESMRVERQYPGILGIGFSMIVPPSEVDLHVLETRNQGFPEYKVWPEGDRNTYTTIIYLEPFSGRNLRAFGYDMFSDPVRQLAMEQARDRDEAILSGKVLLVQETKKDIQAGILMYVPVYRQGLPISTVEERRAAIMGWVYSPYRMSDLMQGILGGWGVKEDKKLRLRIYDGEEASPEKLLFDSGPGGQDVNGDTSKRDISEKVSLAGQIWTLHFAQTGSPLFMSDYTKVWTILTCGITISVLLSWLYLSLASTRERAQRIAQQLTTDLSKSEAKFRLLFASSPDAVFLTRTDGAILLANEEACRMFGYSEEEIFRLGRQDLLGENDQRLDKVAAQRTAAEDYRLECCAKHKCGQVFPVELSSRVYTDQNGEATVCMILRDITERKLREEEIRQLNENLERRVVERTQALNESLNALHESEERFRQLYEKAPIAYQSLGPDGRMLNVNDVWLRILGYCREEVIGQWFGAFLQHDFVPHFEKNFPRFKEAGHITGVEFMMRKKDGSSVLVSYNGAIAHDDAGRMVRSHCVFQDITEQRRLEAHLRQAQKMEALGTLAGGIAHDFNNILAVILGFSEIVHEEALGGHANPDDIKEIMAAAQRAKSLVQQILTFSRKNDPKLQPLSVNQACNKARIILERTILKMIAIECDLTKELPHVLADPTQIEQVLLNLGSNAADAMPEGGHLIFATQAFRTQEEFQRLHPEVPPGEYVLLSVSDTGWGMDENTREHIFEPFFTTKGVGKGTGLGLATVYGIIKAHGGFIYCYSEQGQGTTFRIYLPVAAQQREESEAEEQVDVTSVPGGSETILLVDDENALRAIGERILSGAGYQVLQASSGEDALRIIAMQPSPPDLVITDLGMPGMGGHKAMLEIFSLYPGTKVIIASGYAAQTQVKASMEAGAAAYVSKPFRKVELLGTIRKVLSR